MPRNEELTELMVRYQQGDSAAVTALAARFWPARKPAAATAAPVPELTVGWGQVGLAGQF